MRGNHFREIITEELQFFGGEFVPWGWDRKRYITKINGLMVKPLKTAIREELKIPDDEKYLEFYLFGKCQTAADTERMEIFKRIRIALGGSQIDSEQENYFMVKDMNISDLPLSKDPFYYTYDGKIIEENFAINNNNYLIAAKAGMDKLSMNICSRRTRWLDSINIKEIDPTESGVMWRLNENVLMFLLSSDYTQRDTNNIYRFDRKFIQRIYMILTKPVSKY